MTGVISLEWYWFIQKKKCNLAYYLTLQQKQCTEWWHYLLISTFRINKGKSREKVWHDNTLNINNVKRKTQLMEAERFKKKGWRCAEGGLRTLSYESGSQETLCTKWEPSPRLLLSAFRDHVPKEREYQVFHSLEVPDWERTKWKEVLLPRHQRVKIKSDYK